MTTDHTDFFPVVRFHQYLLFLWLGASAGRINMHIFFVVITLLAFVHAKRFFVLVGPDGEPTYEPSRSVCLSPPTLQRSLPSSSPKHLHLV